MQAPLTPLEFGRRARRLYARYEAVVDGATRLTYDEFFDRCDRWSTVLRELGVSPGDRVVCIAPNTRAHLESFYAIPQIGAVIVPVNYRLCSDDFRYIIEHSGATVVCADGEYLNAIDEVRGDLAGVAHFVAFDGAKPGWLFYEEALGTASPARDFPAIREDDLLSINYTSGTTARPKGVMLTHRNVYLNILGRLAHTHMTSAERYLWTLPMFHVNGWGFVWAVTAVGGTHVCLRKPDPHAVFNSLNRDSITMFCAAPTVLISLAHAPEELRRAAPRGVRVLTAGAPPAAATIQRVEDELGWSITHVYGLTEVSPVVTICEPRSEHRKLDAPDAAKLKARQGVECIAAGEVRVVDDAGEEVPHDGQTLGEIVMRGHAVMDGYYNDPDATAHAFRGGWFHSGDAAVVHPDGYIEIRDRWKDVIISGGENISSVEVEGVLIRHPAVQEAAVVGVSHETWGETPHAFVVLRAGEIGEADALRLFCRDHLAHFKVPREFHFVSELPKTATGKVQKYVLRGGRANVR
ncbi:long-chain-fatty-acid--CoA ligase [Lacipirellula limnantheis]|uniref:Long-chain-fatty-acid--CoA ligase n=1 Tax=Lacipirellula limnantheis TaxID=2528024 RepID=A0A517U4J7_9BACT|nr:long-chain-fatty-acid--CoA ligase [Lacipirellula limnantheis]QDT75561.1 Long-chain-fatty-acid--CoA ligase [Lacipirellula limnantheis]